ncbi:MAG: DinB family protein, partial [Chloroflexota bacterium]
MISHGLLQALFGFNQAMNDRLWTIIMEHLSEAQFVQTDGYSQGSIRNQMVHMADAQHYWLRGLLNRKDLPELEAEDYATREAARAVCRQADQACLDAVRALTEADVERVPDGWSQPVWVGLVQLAHHGTDHRAQILRALH